MWRSMHAAIVTFLFPFIPSDVPNEESVEEMPRRVFMYVEIMV